MSSQAITLPRWIDVGLLPLWNLAVALLVAGGVVLAIGHSPLQALTVLLNGALGSVRGIGYTLYYATTFIFTGLAVAVAIHGGLFNIGGEGQATLGGLGRGACSPCCLARCCRPGCCCRCWCCRPPCSACCGRPCRPICRPGAAVTSSSRRSCSISWPPA